MKNLPLLLLVLLAGTTAVSIAFAPAARRATSARSTMMTTTKKCDTPPYCSAGTTMVPLRRRRLSPSRTSSSLPSLASGTASESSSLPSPEESARALTDFMAKAHEEKLRAVRDVENRYKGEIQQLKSKLQQYEGRGEGDSETTSSPSSTAPSASSSSPPGSNSYEFPATNKEMSAKIRSYRHFLSDYLVKAQKEKHDAVADAEERTKAKYEAIIEELLQQRPQQQEGIE